MKIPHEQTTTRKKSSEVREKKIQNTMYFWVRPTERARDRIDGIKLNEKRRKRMRAMWKERERERKKLMQEIQKANNKTNRKTKQTVEALFIIVAWAAKCIEVLVYAWGIRASSLTLSLSLPLSLSLSLFLRSCVECVCVRHNIHREINFLFLTIYKCTQHKHTHTLQHIVLYLFIF